MIRSLAMAVVVVLFVPSVASAQNFYTAIGGGAGRTPATNDGRPGFEDPSEHKTGFTGSAAVGYAWPFALRGEGEIGFLRAPVKSDAGVALGGSVKSYLLMANLRHDIKHPFLGFKPYVGFGLGGARLNYEDEFINFVGVKMQAHEWRNGFAYQARAGIGYNVNQSLDLTLGYRYVHISGGHIQQQQGPARVRVNFDAVKNHSIEVGFVVKF
jgi:opacity protein-like surface antigen